jgi:hypothetical protein
MFSDTEMSDSDSPVLNLDPAIAASYREEKFCILYTHSYIQSTNIRPPELPLSQLPHLAMGLSRPMGYPWAGQAFLAGP